MTRSKINLAIVEDDKQIQSILINYFKRDEINFDAVNAYSSIEEVLTVVDNLDNFIFLLDINLQGMSGIDGIFHIKNKWSLCEIIMISVLGDSNSIFKSICAGASGYLDKDTPLGKIKEAVIALSEGGSPITPAIARKVFDYFQPSKNLTENLTKRERDVVQGLVEGLSYKLIASKLDISIDTVRKYIRSIYNKLHVNSKGELLAIYRQIP
ncbi:MAG: response regulator transcription factor [Bacteroidota bacterium]|nr:response regulator transcription factor [Bacteroidota bacterium]